MMTMCIAAMTLITACSKQDPEQGDGKGVRSIASASINAEPSSKTECRDLENSMSVTWEQHDMFLAYNTQRTGSLAQYITDNGAGKKPLARVYGN